MDSMINAHYPWPGAITSPNHPISRSDLSHYAKLYNVSLVVSNYFDVVLYFIIIISVISLQKMIQKTNEISSVPSKYQMEWQLAIMWIYVII